MANSRCTRRLQTRLTGSLQRELPLTMGGNNFAAFCGTPDQRRQTLLQAVSRFCGRCGIVVLHDDPQLEPLLSALPQQLANSGSAPQNFQVQTLQRRNYDPLYGLDEDTIVNLLLPCEDNTYPSAELQQVRAGLMAYLSIMQYRFRQSPQLFGSYPYNLDLLMQLVQMPFMQLDSDVLSYLPANVAAGLRPVLSRPGMQQNVHSAVLPYATAMAKYYWTPSGLQGHSRRSIVQAVQTRQMICLHIPNSRQDLMNWICAELQMLTDRGLPFLLIASDLHLTNCRRLQSWFLHPSGANQYFGLFAPSMDSVSSSTEETAAVFSHYDQIFVYRCNSTAQAAPFSHNYGEYERRQTERSRQTFLPFPWLLPTFSGGRQVRHITEPNIRAEELMDLRNGVFLCGGRYPIPVLIRRFQLPGGDNRVLSLP